MSGVWEPRPLPNVTPETKPFWVATINGEFVICTCENCDLTYYYPRSYCPDCFSNDIDWHPSEGRGTVYSYSIAENVVGWWEEALPLVVAYVRLVEGPLVVTNVVGCDPDKVEVGMEVAVTFIETERGDVAIPVFEPA